MSPTMKTHGIDNLPSPERIILLQDIWDSLVDEQAIPELRKPQKHELDRRIADLDAHPENVLTWEQIKESILRGR
jgi:putative addiction module component (TIGR02574 family)